jgi:hypothetical protein
VPRASVRAGVGRRGTSGFLATSCAAHPCTPSRPR